MLIITRRAGEKIMLGDDIVVHVMEIVGNTVRVGIQAPRSVPVYREEIWDAHPGRERGGRLGGARRGPRPLRPRHHRLDPPAPPRRRRIVAEPAPARVRARPGVYGPGSKPTQPQGATTWPHSPSAGRASWPRPPRPLATWRSRTPPGPSRGPDRGQPARRRAPAQGPGRQDAAARRRRRRDWRGRAAQARQGRRAAALQDGRRGRAGRRPRTSRAVQLRRPGTAGQHRHAGAGARARDARAARHGRRAGGGRRRRGRGGRHRGHAHRVRGRASRACRRPRRSARWPKAGEGESEGLEQAESDLADRALQRDAGGDPARERLDEVIEQASDPSSGETPEALRPATDPPPDDAR